MPTISRQGFIDLSAIEYLVDTSKAYEHLGRAVSIYGIWKDLGKMPRTVFPESSIPNVLQVEEESKDGNVGQVQVQKSTKPAVSDPKCNMKVKGGEQKVEALSKGDEFVDVDFTKEEEKVKSVGTSKTAGQHSKAVEGEEKATKTAVGIEDEPEGEFGLRHLYRDP